MMNFDITTKIRDLVNDISNIHKHNLESSKSSGKLQNFKTHININDTRFLVQFEMEDYWKYVERGRSPGKFPPLNEIESWIRIKPIIPDARTGKVPDTRQLAFLISRKIAREGTPAQKPLEKTLQSTEVNSLINAIKQEFIDQVIEYIRSSAKGD